MDHFRKSGFRAHQESLGRIIYSNYGIIVVGNDKLEPSCTFQPLQAASPAACHRNLFV